MADRQLFDRPDAAHRFHDLLLVAAYAAGDVGAADEARARAMAEGCDECASLVVDLRAIARATPTLPVPPRTRDYRLKPADAARLRPHGLGRVAAVFDTRRLQLARPLATGLTMLGLVGVLLTSVPSFSLGGAASMPATTGAGGPDASTLQELQADASFPPAGSAEAAQLPADGSAGPTEDSRDILASDPPATRLAGGDSRTAAPSADVDLPAPAPAAASPVASIRLASLVALIVGLALLVASTVMTRRRRA